jgi:adenylate cyclase
MPDDVLIAPYRPRRVSQLRRLWFGIIILAFLCLFTAPFYVNNVALNAPTAKQGVVSFSKWGALKNPVELRGDWTFIWRSALGQRPAGSVTPMIMHLPGEWAGVKTPSGDVLSEQGRATYQLVIKGLKPGTYRLYMPLIYSATQISINGEIVSRRGMLGMTAATTAYLARAHEVFFRSDGRDVTLAIDVASFRHRDNGVENSPVLGLAEPMQYWTALQWGQEFLFHTTLVLLGTFSIGVFLFRRSDKASLYLAISSFLFLVPSAVQGFDNLFLMAFPGFSFAAMLGAHYVATTLSLGFFLAYVHALFPLESPSRFFRALLAVFAVQIIIQVAGFLIGGTLLASQVNMGLMLVMALVFSYVFFVLVRAVANDRDGAIMFLLGMGIFFLSITMLTVVAYGLMSSDEVVGYDLTGYGILILLFSHIIVLAERWSAAIFAAEQMNDDLRQLLDVNMAITTETQLESLLKKIVEVTSKILHADRSSLLLFDEKRDELWSLVAEGVGTREIRFPASAGLAGYALIHGETVNVSNAYEDTRFIREMDAETGYKTTSIVSMPVTSRDGRKLGVMQALNRRDAIGFSNEDIAKMGAFAAQAAIAIDNANLFSEIVASRNYNESILRSMSSGVITINTEGQITKLNEAACEIFGVDAATAEGADLRTFLTAANPWSLTEIESVNRSGQAKTLYDVDVATFSGAIISANITIVPLINDNEKQGLLILIEDISEGKRLERAMRRFLTQNVVDQVLGREDDLLFGTACKATVLFADIRNFTSLAETMPPRATVDMLNEIFTELFEAVAASDGVLDKYIGDALMAVYGAPISSGRDPSNAVASAIQMQKMIREINIRRRARNLTELRLGIGIASGDVVAGTIGSPKRMDYTVIGDSVNLAARLEDATKYFGVDIIVCETTAASLDDHVNLRELDLMRLRGRQQPSTIFEILPEQVGCADQDAMVTAYREGRHCLARRGWADALAAFELALKINPSDHPSLIMAERAKILIATPPENDWDGVWLSRRGLPRM